jgi:SAM-dependent methyltransferase
MGEANLIPAEVDSIRRFSDRVADYLKARPRYPMQALTYLRDTIDLQPTDLVADIGSGTGFLSEMFLNNGNQVYGVEPNKEMRTAAEEIFATNTNFVSVVGTAEDTGLPNEIIDLVTAGQAFHWFDPGQAREEFRRILRSGGHVVLVWNVRQVDGSPFMRDYEAMLHALTRSYVEVNHQNNTGEDILEEFYAPHGFQFVSFPNAQQFSFEGLRSRLLSSSYSPQPGQAEHAPLMVRLAELFAKHAEGGMVAFLYETIVYLGRLGA